ncbi:hypothetical protein OU814_31290, partial [Leptolyngbya sp. GGD]|nr:hypothetical protein [Leptolyngbya sp. GGD]
MTFALSEIALSQPEVEADLKQLEIWTNDFNALMTRLALRFKRAELRERVKDCLQGLFNSAECKNSWQLAEQLGQSTLYGIQHL